jgi:hypothetical protein
MDSPTGNEWFYSRDGVQLGPVTLEELSRVAQSGGIHPRQDLVWRNGMSNWVPAGEIDGLFERRVPATQPAESQAVPSRNPYTTPGAELIFEAPSAWPGARRRGYIFGAVILPFLIGIGLGIADSVGVILDPYVRIALEWVIPMVVGFYFTLQRFPNLGMSRWWTLGYLVPILNVWVGYRQFACPAGYAIHKKLDGAGIALAILYWLVVLALIGLFVFLVLILIGVSGDAEMRTLFEDALREATQPMPEQ